MLYYCIIFLRIQYHNCNRDIFNFLTDLMAFLLHLSPLGCTDILDQYEKCTYVFESIKCISGLYKLKSNHQ